MTREKAHVAQHTGKFEYYTPRKYIEAARLTMGSIDVDPASSAAANKTVDAAIFYTRKDNGLRQKWMGNVWLNPPFSQPLVSKFCNLLISKYLRGEVKRACVIVNNATETGFYQNMLKHCKAVCYIKGRVRFIDANGGPGGSGPLQGQTVLYFGEDPQRFAENFGQFGAVLYVNHAPDMRQCFLSQYQEVAPKPNGTEEAGAP